MANGPLGLGTTTRSSTFWVAPSGLAGPVPAIIHTDGRPRPRSTTSSKNSRNGLHPGVEEAPYGEAQGGRAETDEDHARALLPPRADPGQRLVRPDPEEHHGTEDEPQHQGGRAGHEDE